MALANVDNAGLAEIVVGRHVYTLDHDDEGALVFVDVFEGNLSHGDQHQGPASCVADITGDARQEVIAGSTVYGFPALPPGVTRQSECDGSETEAEHVAFCAGELLLVWDGRDVNGSAARREGFCAIADVLNAEQVAPPGPDNPLDGLPEVIVVNAGDLQIFAAQDGTMVRDPACCRTPSPS